MVVRIESFSPDWDDTQKLRWFFWNAIDSAIKNYDSGVSNVLVKIENPILGRNQSEFLVTQTNDHNSHIKNKNEEAIKFYKSLEPVQRMNVFTKHIGEARPNKQYIHHFPKDIDRNVRSREIEATWHGYVLASKTVSNIIS